MSEIILKLPRKRNRVKIVRNSDEIDKFLDNRISNSITGYRKKGSVKDLLNKNIFESDSEERLNDNKTIYTHKFVISESNQPYQISLSNIPLSSIPLKEAKIEVQSAYDRGFLDGNEASGAAYQEEINTHKSWIKSIDSLVKAMKSQFIKETSLFRDEVIPVAIMIAEHIIAHEITKDNSIIIEQVKKAINSLYEDKIIRISVNPEDVNILSNVKSDLLSDKSKIEGVVITADSSIARGGCILYTDAGVVDARVKTQLEKIRDSLTEMNNNPLLYEEIIIDKQTEDDELIDNSIHIESKNQESD
jgi:flagellar biosynthesis/type III secretory pathway protein FliH